MNELNARLQALEEEKLNLKVWRVVEIVLFLVSTLANKTNSTDQLMVDARVKMYWDEIVNSDAITQTVNLEMELLVDR